MGTPDFNATDIAARDAKIQDLQQQLADARRQEQYLTAVTRTTANLASERSLPLTLTAMAEEIVQADELVGVQVLTNEHASGKLHMLGMAGFPPSLSSSFYAKLKQCEQLGADLMMLKAFHLAKPVVIETATRRSCRIHAGSHCTNTIGNRAGRLRLVSDHVRERPWGY